MEVEPPKVGRRALTPIFYAPWLDEPLEAVQGFAAKCRKRFPTAYGVLGLADASRGI
jgi:hypothetical protein